MEVGRLLTLIFEATERARDSCVSFFGSPYTATSVSAMENDIYCRLEHLNRELRNELGIEIYVEVIPDFTSSKNAVIGVPNVRKCGIEEVNLEWVEQSVGEQRNRERKLINQKCTRSQRSKLSRLKGMLGMRQ